jgi:hypothetical protein
MIDAFVAKWYENSNLIRDKFAAKHPYNYKEIVTAVIEILASGDEDEDYGKVPDAERIHEIDDGDYQGTLVYVIGANGYQPDRYWYVKVGYGSCSYCDTLERIRGYSSDLPTEEQVRDYMTLALHILQGLHEMNSTVDE